MTTISLRTLVREPRRVKRITRTGKPVQVTDNGEPLWIIQPTNGSAADEARRRHEIDAELARIERWLRRKWLAEGSADCEPAFARAQKLSEKHTERVGCRGLDLLHVALALELECEVFLTADRIQGAVAQAEGIEVTVS